MRAWMRSGAIAIALAGCATAERYEQPVLDGAFVAMTVGPRPSTPALSHRAALRSDDPAAKVALSQMYVGEGVLVGRLITKAGVVWFEASAPSGAGDRPSVRRSGYADTAGAWFLSRDGAAQMSVIDYKPGRSIWLRFRGVFEGRNDGERFEASVEALVPLEATRPPI